MLAIHIQRCDWACCQLIMSFLHSMWSEEISTKLTENEPLFIDCNTKVTQEDFVKTAAQDLPGCLM